jgi:drug/metabolite transporter (DMT)-like permease
VLISYAQFRAGSERYIGILLMIASTVLFSLSNILLKKLDTSDIDPLEQSLGAMVFALPGLLLCWYVVDGQLPGISATPAAGAVVYLATVGSLLGFMAFYYVLRSLPFEVVGLVPLITPVLAMLLGVVLAGESISAELRQGSLLILAGLAVYELMPTIVSRLRRPQVPAACKQPDRLVVVGGGAGAAQNQ